MNGDRFDDRTRTRQLLGRPGRGRGELRVAPGVGGVQKTAAPRFRQRQKLKRSALQTQAQHLPGVLRRARERHLTQAKVAATCQTTLCAECCIPFNGRQAPRRHDCHSR